MRALGPDGSTFATTLGKRLLAAVDDRISKRSRAGSLRRHRLSALRDRLAKLLAAVGDALRDLRNRLSPTSAAILRVIGAFDESCWLSQDKIGERVAVCGRTVRTHLRALEADGFIETDRRGLNQTNRYRLLKGPRIAAARFRSRTAKSADNPFLRNGIKNRATAPPARAVACEIPKKTEPTVDPELVAALMAEGVSPRIAAQLVATYDADRIREQIAWLPDRRVNDPAAAVVTAIRQSWSKPRPRPKRVDRNAFSYARRPDLSGETVDPLAFKSTNPNNFGYHRAGRVDAQAVDGRGTDGERIQQLQRAEAEATIANEVAQLELEAQRGAEFREVVRAERELPPEWLEQLRATAHGIVDATFPEFLNRNGFGFLAVVETEFRRQLNAMQRGDDDVGVHQPCNAA